MKYDQFRAMNSDILLGAEGEAEQLAKGFQEARRYIEASEKRFTRFSEDSELADLNRSAGSWFRASAEMFDLVREAHHFLDLTGGLFDPSILPALKQAGYDRSMDEIRLRHSILPSRSYLSDYVRSDFYDTQFDRQRRHIWLTPGVQIDLGGIAKGWIAERAARILSAYASACVVNAGGDMFMVGTPSQEDRWGIALEDPRDPANTLAVLRVDDGAVATSSITKRRWLQGDQPRHHLIDPRSGRPVETDWLSVTVIASHATTAEVFAKALLIAGSHEAVTFPLPVDVAAFIGVREDGTLWGSKIIKEYIDGRYQSITAG
ncbi:MAG: FAD:protein FMN transferase [Chloroflexi bacterium]|nr:FAD:protein FMN transferase [Chloroflexota bacterium]